MGCNTNDNLFVWSYVCTNGWCGWNRFGVYRAFHITKREDYPLTHCLTGRETCLDMDTQMHSNAWHCYSRRFQPPINTVDSTHIIRRLHFPSATHTCSAIVSQEWFTTPQSTMVLVIWGSTLRPRQWMFAQEGNKIKQKMIRSDLIDSIDSHQKCSRLCLGVGVVSIFTSRCQGARWGRPLSCYTTSILRCFVTQTQTHARICYPASFSIISKSRVQEGSKWKTIPASILRLLYNERRLYGENVSRQLTVEQGHFVRWSRRGRPGYSAWIYLYEVTELL